MEGLTSRWVLLISIVLGIASCKKEDQTLPPMTREGRNTLGFRLESGELLGGDLDLDDGFVFADDTLKIHLGCTGVYGFMKPPDKTYLHLNLHRSPLTNEFSLADSYLIFGDYQYPYGGAIGLDTAATNTVQIDYTNDARNIVSGQFDLSFIQVSDTTWFSDSTYYFDTLYTNRAYDGRFDIKYLD